MLYQSWSCRPAEVVFVREVDEVRARDNRRNATREETLTWRWLRDRRFTGLKFRRQRPLGDYIADFYCAKLRLAIELDGRGHEAFNRQMYDVVRDCELSKLGVTVIRISNEAVRNDATAVTDHILNTIRKLQSA